MKPFNQLHTNAIFVGILTGFLSATATATANEQNTPAFGGPNTVENQTDTDFGVTLDTWKQNLKDDHGFTVSVDYTSVVLTANETLGDNEGAGGIARAYGTFDLFDVDNGTLVWKFEHRHAYGDVSPFDFSLGELGYVGLQEAPFNDSNFRTQNLYWRQRMNDGRSVLIAGVLDATDYVDAFALASPWLHFMNLAFSTGSAAIGLPNDAAVGVAYGTMLGDNFYLIGGITDTNGDPSRPFDGFENFVNEGEYFKSIELGYTSSQERIIFDNYHMTLWHKDEQDEAGVPDGWGLAFSASRYVGDKLMPFVRGAYTDDGGSLLQRSLSAGLGYQPQSMDGLLGVGINWGEPNETTFGKGLAEQQAIEVFYRADLGKHVAVTGDVQYIQDPALNPAEDRIWMLNLRARFVF